MADEYSAPNEDEAKENAAIVLNQLVESLSTHYKLMKTQARAIIRQALMEI